MYALIVQLIRSTTVLLDMLSEYTCTGMLKQVAVKQKKKLGQKNFREKLTTNGGKERQEDYSTSVAYSCRVVFLSFFLLFSCSRVVFLCVLLCLVSILLTGHP